MKKYLFDTTVIIDYLRNDPKVPTLFNEIQSPTVSAITVCEVYQGARNNLELKKLKSTLSSFKVYHLSEPISKRLLYLVERYHLSSGLLISDGIIAATALENQLTLLTSNSKHFQRIEGLKVEKWH